MRISAGMVYFVGMNATSRRSCPPRRPHSVLGTLWRWLRVLFDAHAAQSDRPHLS
jgi:hypothetical protein